MKKQQIVIDLNDAYVDSLQLSDGGSKGMEITYSFTMKLQGHIYPVQISETRAVMPALSLSNAIKSLKYEVAKIVQLDYVQDAYEIPGTDLTDHQKAILDQKFESALSTIEVFGISFKEKKSDEGITIKYKKYDTQGKPKGTSTSWVNLQTDDYGIYESINEKINLIKTEINLYLSGIKFSESAQLAIPTEPEDQPVANQKTLDEGIAEYAEDAQVVHSDD